MSTFRPTGQDTVDAIREWAKDEIKNGPSRAYDLGKLYLGLSVATIGAILSLQRLLSPRSLNSLHTASLLFALLSILTAVNMVRPRLRQITGETDLFEAHAQVLKRASRHAWCWLVTWLVGVLLAILATA